VGPEQNARRAGVVAPAALHVVLTGVAKDGLQLRGHVGEVDAMAGGIGASPLAVMQALVRMRDVVMLFT
jgi:hypothetical protein